jgi:hypothetical protein
VIGPVVRKWRNNLELDRKTDKKKKKPKIETCNRTGTDCIDAQYQVALDGFFTAIDH